MKYLVFQRIPLKLETKNKETNDDTNNSFSTEQVNIFCKIWETVNKSCKLNEINLFLEI